MLLSSYLHEYPIRASLASLWQAITASTIITLRRALLSTKKPISTQGRIWGGGAMGAMAPPLWVDSIVFSTVTPDLPKWNGYANTTSMPTCLLLTHVVLCQRVYI